MVLRDDSSLNIGGCFHIERGLLWGELLSTVIMKVVCFLAPE